MNALTRGFLVGRAILTAICKGQVLLVLLVFMGQSSLLPKAALGQIVEWKPLQLARQSDQAMVFDSRRGVTVLFGGSRGAGVASGETWEWIDDKWTLRSLTGPSPRALHSMAYDSARGVTVLFGGTAAGGTGPGNDETWEWDGNAWTQRAVTGPSARRGHQMVYDSARGVVVLFGGATAIGAFPCSGDTWEWNGSVWTQRSSTGPSPRFMHAMAYDIARGVTVLIGGKGGFDGATPNSETWEWNGSLWTQRQVPGLFGSNPSMTYDSLRHVTVAFGFNRISEWDGDAWTVPTVSGPSARSGQSMSFDSAQGVTLLFGGSQTSEMWKWIGGIWVQLTFNEPTRRYGPAMAFDRSRGASVLFGGTVNGSQGMNDTWERDGTTWHQVASGGPSSRFYHAMTYDSARETTVLFGGFTSGNVVSNETWEWNGAVWNPMTIGGPLPSPRGGHAMAFDAIRGVTVLFGGYTGASIYNNETWEWNGATWTLRATSGPSVRAWYAMAFDTSRGVTVLFGGWDGHHNLADTWEWNGSTWSQRAVGDAAPSGRASGAMVYDPVRGVCVLFGGGNGVDAGETWEWNGASWHQRIVAGPSARSDHAMVYDTVREVPMLFGGYVNGPIFVNQSSETWGLLAFCAADFNHDGAVDFFDYDDFVVAFEAGEASADADGDGTVDFFDYDAFVVAFEVGC